MNFVVWGSQGDEYSVTFKKSGSKLNAFCTCPAGDNGSYCKHRVALMNGEFDGVKSRNTTDITSLRQMMNGTNLEQAYQEFVVAENAYAESKRRFDLAKKRLTNAMYM